MPQPRIIRTVGHVFSGRTYQTLAILACLLLGLAMIINTQMGGEAMWFWYGTLFHQGVKLYSGLHTALQPFFVLETDAWMQLVGRRIAFTEMLSVIHILLMCLALLLILRESDWRDWQKACVLLGAFALTVSGHSYRFDDYHVVAEAFIFYALLLLLLVARADVPKRMFLWVGLLGLVCGLTITTRLTDGAALLAAAVICLFFLARQHKFAAVALFLVTSAVTVLVVVALTGDSFSSYVFSSIIRAAGSKGGTGSIFAAPFLMLRNTIPLFFTTTKRILLSLAAIVAIGPLVYRYWRAGIRFIFGLQLAACVLVFLLVPKVRKLNLIHGELIQVAVLSLTILMYVLPIIVVVRMIRARLQHKPWDPREVIVCLPLAEWASYSAGAAAEPLTNYYAPVALLLLMVPVLQPFRKYAIWLNASFALIMTLLALSSISGKILTPYDWQNYKFSAMFKNRVWYHHPVYGEMYIDKDLLSFSESVCKDIGADPGKTSPSLLSLPYPFPNYFCATPPWHNYVQTFFDTSTRATIENLMLELETAPPDYVVYQRQLNIMRGSERLYNHGQPLAQRSLDKMILQKISTGQWKLLQQSDYLTKNEPHAKEEEGWYVIQTHP